MGILERIEREQAARAQKAVDEIVSSGHGSGAFETASEASADERRTKEQSEAIKVLQSEPDLATAPPSHLIWELMRRFPDMSQAEAAKTVTRFERSNAAPAARSKPRRRGFGWAARFRRGQ